ncbi:hypothetical protein HK102_012028, partial [Quaeritorhiza haematococci]
MKVINFVQEVIVPIVMGRVSTSMATKKKAKTNKPATTTGAGESQSVISEEEEEWLDRVREELARPTYDVFDDYSEMVTQFGYIVLFSVAWPLSPLACLLNNWLELRSDAVKICRTARRPLPLRDENIGPWASNL